MRLTPRLILRLALVLVVLGLIWFRLLPGLLHRSRSLPAPAASDLSASSPLNQPGGGPAPADAYPIYSALYQKPTPDTAGEPLVFAENSRTDIPQVGTSCLKPSTPEEHALADAFAAANRQSHAWQQKFSIPQSYRLLTPKQTADVQACLQAHGQGPVACAGYRGVRHVRFLGIPGVDASGTHALVSVIKSCGNFCGSGGIFEVEKAGGTWQRAAPSAFTEDCSWAY